MPVDAAVPPADATVLPADTSSPPVDASVLPADAALLPPDACAPQPERCNGQDDDCDGTADNPTGPCYDGPPGTAGTGLCREGLPRCLGAGDLPACEGQVLPADETCDGEDNDCNGLTDDLPDCDCVPGTRRDCYPADPATQGVGPCTAGTQACLVSGQWSPCEGQVTPAPEICNGLDDDCDGTPDDTLVFTFYPDTDRDGWGDGTRPSVTCRPPEDSVQRPGDCFDDDPASHPGAVERCDARDNDCDQSTDEAPLDDCAFPHAEGLCAGGVCDSFRCLDEWVDANQRPEDGCERGCDPGASPIDLGLPAPDWLGYPTVAVDGDRFAVVTVEEAAEPNTQQLVLYRGGAGQRLALADGVTGLGNPALLRGPDGWLIGARLGPAPGNLFVWWVSDQGAVTPALLGAADSDPGLAIGTGANGPLAWVAWNRLQVDSGARTTVASFGPPSAPGQLSLPAVIGFQFDPMGPAPALASLDGQVYLGTIIAKAPDYQLAVTSLGEHNGAPVSYLFVPQTIGRLQAAARGGQLLFAFSPSRLGNAQVTLATPGPDGFTFVDPPLLLSGELRVAFDTLGAAASEGGFLVSGNTRGALGGTSSRLALLNDDPRSFQEAGARPRPIADATRDMALASSGAAVGAAFRHFDGNVERVAFAWLNCR